MNTLLDLKESEIGLGVLDSTLPVVEMARHVWIDQRAIQSLCERLLEGELELGNWDERYHWNDGTIKTATAILILDAWNFCFWPDLGQTKWTVKYKGKTLNGYMALAASVKRAIEQGYELYDPRCLVDLTAKDIKKIFRGQGEIPMLDKRLEHAHEVGRGLLDKWDGDFANMLRAAEGSAVSLTELVVETFPSFEDVTIYRGREVKLYKRAQILPVDLMGGMKDEPLVQFHDIDRLTAFADYKIPQVLEAHRVLRYSPALEALLERQEGLVPGDSREVEIRAAMIWAVEMMRRSLQAAGRPTPSFELDWMLWSLGQEPVENERPYHRTRTIFY
jgi:putative queuosine salvage protein